MADTIATLALKTTLDSDGLIQGFQRSEQAMAGFAKSAASTSDNLAQQFTGARNRISGFFGNVSSGNAGAVFRDLTAGYRELRTLWAQPIEPNLSKAQQGVRDLVSTASRTGIDVGRALGGGGATASGGVATQAATQAAQQSAAAANAVRTASAESAAASTGAASATASGWAGAASSLLTSAGTIARAGGIAVGAIVGIYEASRAATRNLSAMSLEARRLGVSTDDVQILRRGFARFGFDAAETELTINRLAQHIGDVTLDPSGATGQSLRRLNIDVQQFTQLNARQQIEQLADAMSRMTNRSERNAEAMNLFGRQYMQALELLQRGGGVFRDEESRAARGGVFGSTLVAEEATQAARRAEVNWRESGLGIADIWGGLKARGSELFAFMGEEMSEFARNSMVTLGLARTAEQAAAAMGPRRSAVPPPPSFDQTVRGVLDANASTEGVIAALRNIPPLVEARSPSAVRIALEDRLRAMTEEVQVTTQAREAAEDLGLVQVNAARSAVDAVRDLIQARRELQRGGASPEQLNDFDTAARAVAVSRAERDAGELAIEWGRAADHAGMTARQIQIIEAAQRGVNQSLLEELSTRDKILSTQERARTFQQEAQQMLQAARSPLEAFEAEIDRIQTLVTAGAVKETDADRLRGQALQNLDRAQGSRPSSFGLRGTDARSVEGALAADDFRIRGQIESQDPQERVRQILESAREQQAAMLQEQRDAGATLREIRDRTSPVKRF